MANSTIAAENDHSDTVSSFDPALMELFVDEIKDSYWAENYQVQALPEMQRAAVSEVLKDAIINHLRVTKDHVRRLERVFDLLERDAYSRKCNAMEGLIQEAEEIIEDTAEGSAARDAGIILAVQKVEHYEIASYTGLIQLAKKIDRDDIAVILSEILQEERDADELLTRIGEDHLSHRSTEES